MSENPPIQVGAAALNAAPTDPKAMPEPSKDPAPDLRMGIARGKVVLSVRLVVEGKVATVGFEFSPEEAGQFAYQIVQLGNKLNAMTPPTARQHAVKVPARRLILPGQ